MRQQRAGVVDLSDSFRSLPMLLGALLAVVTAVDVLLAWQPALLHSLSQSWQRMVTMKPIAAPAAHVLAATAAVACTIVASTALLVFARAARLAPHLWIAPAWVALCMLSVSLLPSPVPLPVSTPLFAGLSALLFVGACVLLRSGSAAGSAGGGLLLALPFAVLGSGYSRVASHGMTRDVVLFGTWLALCAVGVVLIALTRSRENTIDVPGMEGVDVVEELFSQVERAERAEARLADLERQLGQGHSGRTLRRVR